MDKVKNASFQRALEFGWDVEMAPTSLDKEIEQSELGENEVRLMWDVFNALCEDHHEKVLCERLSKEIKFFWDTVGSALRKHKNSPYSLK